jgi:flagellar hook-associated protein 3 FlgL
MDQATQIAAQSSNTMQTPATMQTLALQVQSLMSQMVALSQTQVQGRYIFSGDDDQNPSYQLDPTSPTGVLQLTTAGATRQIQDPEGGTFQASLTAQQIFDNQASTGGPAPDNVFNALNSLYLALQSNNQAGITAAQNMINQASQHLNNSQGFYGNVETQIQNASSYVATYTTQLKTQISTMQDADVTSAALQLTQASTQLQAAFQSQSKMPTTSLFSFLG